ncbi:hypothetical protein BDV95DRAFT_571691 [Massariosphaeria phaeospora]|uniref:Uncharacterized protein n=1 Tax=Massariosphaeria phaeospora TaxID=100035 RepID=A0A7C8I6T2_9PLEO|nr:hypothetical protein BDV95DRAFT_571691 [Massariosphaeria phaeospora]
MKGPVRSPLRRRLWTGCSDGRSGASGSTACHVYRPRFARGGLRNAWLRGTAKQRVLRLALPRITSGRRSLEFPTFRASRLDAFLCFGRLKRHRRCCEMDMHARIRSGVYKRRRRSTWRAEIRIAGWT